MHQSAPSPRSGPAADTGASAPAPAPPAGATYADVIGSTHGRPQPVRINIPRRDGDLRFWLGNFARQLAERPDHYHIDPQQAREMLRLAEAYDAAYWRITDPTTRTTPNIADKDAAKAEALRAARALANTIKVDPRISAAAKVGLGFKVARRR